MFRERLGKIKFSKIKDVFSAVSQGNTLFYPGCITRLFLRDIYENYKELFSDLGMDCLILNDLSCCGAPLLNAGYQKDFDEVVNQNRKILQKHKIAKIITNCPHCYQVFNEIYQIPAFHTTQILHEHIRKLSGGHHGEVSYHDPCILARKNNIINEPRQLIKNAGYQIQEPMRTRKNTFCCGAGGGLKQNNPIVSNKIAKKRLEQLGSNKVIVSCPYCYAQFRQNTTKKKIYELSQALMP
jgi:Fe-S oxidoreductase